ncbi:MAG: TerB family tellurite resistance protein [Pseudomonadota bacterium]
MIDSIQRFFNDFMVTEAGGKSASAPTLELATAALLFEVARADYHLDDSEVALLRDQLRRRFSLEETDLDELLQLAREEAESAVDHYQFVSLVKEHFDYAQRCELVRMMWSLSLADGEQHHLEEHRIRRLAELLHVSHSDFIRAKLHVQEGTAD